MTHEEKRQIKACTRVEYKRNGEVGARTGSFVFHSRERNGKAQCAILDDHTGKLSRGRLSRILRVIETPTPKGGV